MYSPRHSLTYRCEYLKCINMHNYCGIFVVQFSLSLPLPFPALHILCVPIALIFHINCLPLASFLRIITESVHCLFFLFILGFKLVLLCIFFVKDLWYFRCFVSHTHILARNLTQVIYNLQYTPIMHVAHQLGQTRVIISEKTQLHLYHLAVHKVSCEFLVSRF